MSRPAQEGVLVPELQEQLVAAAARTAPPRPAPVASPARSQFAAATPARRAAEGPRRRRGGARLGRRTPVLLAALALLACAAAALAATGLLSGAPVTLPPGTPLLPHSGLGVPLPDSPTGVALEVPDPAGGPPWGARLVKTTRGYGCLQIGRVEHGALGVIGQDGAFHDDGRFHELPTDYLEGAFPCGPLDRAGHSFGGVVVLGTPASALSGEPTCTAPERPHRAGEPPTCPAADERLVTAGMAGPLARSVTYADEDGRLRTIPTAGPDGIYLIVERAPRLGVEDGEFAPSGEAGGGTIRAIAYSGGRVCHLTAGRGAAGLTQQRCPSLGEREPARPQLTPAQVSSPVSLSLRTERVQMRYSSAVMPMLDISFRAPVAVTSASSQYVVRVRYPGHKRNCALISEGPVLSDVRRGQLVHQHVSENGCRGVFHVAVLYVYDSARTDGLLGGLRGPYLTVGTQTLRVR
jgi:hypothetical protein